MWKMIQSDTIISDNYEAHPRKLVKLWCFYPTGEHACTTENEINQVNRKPQPATVLRRSNIPVAGISLCIILGEIASGKKGSGHSHHVENSRAVSAAAQLGQVTLAVGLLARGYYYPS
ncbi:predicted protein [Histoplasma capsulatum var. duboisii H88]|uniref:Predicted protein n=2 Tax=Ajellomyces capsulatus TaxID=5037 RepID=F0UER5_AJEC8|nr:predicted protein [Histoplasma capsulatum H143]EGC44795.1 predicted protein [Histoplasma capsulatum var. duboisii H88]